MKLLKDNEFISRKKVKQLFLATSIMVLALYVIAMICSLLGLKTFILNYQNSTMDKIEAFLHQYSLYPFASDVFLTIEFFIILSFVLQKRPHWIYVLIFYALPLGIHYAVGGYPEIVWTLFPFAFYFTIPIIDQAIEIKNSEEGKAIRYYFAMTK